MAYLGYKPKVLPQPTFDEKDKYKLSNRILTYLFIKSYLDSNLNPNDCLTVKKFGDKTGYTIRDIVDLEEEFGSQGEYSLITKTTIYRTVLNKKIGRYILIAKVMNGDIKENTNMNESILMKRITKELILTELSKHFVIMYKSTFCEDIKVERPRRLVCLNELCDGDIRGLLTDDMVINNKDTFLNILFQSFISLATFHNMIGYTHNDTHNGNFLYQANTEEGYYRYELGDTSFYLKSCPYNICLYDFGHSKILRDEGESIHTIPYNSTSIYNDYHLLIDNFNEKDNTSMMVSIMEIIKKYFQTNKNNPQFKILFFEEILRLMKEHSPSGMIVDELPEGTVPLNEKPFIISNHKAEGGSRGGSSGSRSIVVKYKSTGEHVHIVYKNKKLKRCVYRKMKGRGKYCKINKVYILLSKLKLVDE